MNVAPHQTTRKKGMHGCVVALLIFGGICLVGAIVAGVGAFAFVQSDVGQKAIRVVGEGKRLSDKGQSAPGAAELRAHGCDVALVLDGRDYDELNQLLEDASSIADSGVGDMKIIACQVQTGHPIPSCDDLAATYLAAVGGEAKFGFAVNVQQNGSEPVCRSTYDAHGSLVMSNVGLTPATR